MHTILFLIPLLQSVTASYIPSQNNPQCLTQSQATLFATQTLNIPTLPQEDRLPALQILAQENFTFTSDGASFFLQLPLSLPITNSISSYLDYIAPIPPSTKPWKLLWIGNTCDTITIYREYYFGEESFPVRSIDFMKLNLDDGKLEEWMAAVNGAAALYAHERVEYTSKAFPQRPGQGVGVGLDGLAFEESGGCGKEGGKGICLGRSEAMRVVEDYGKLLVSKPVDVGLAEKVLNEDAEMISDSMGFVTMGLVNRTNIKSRAKFVDRAIGVLQSVSGGEVKILKLAWNCDSIVQYVEFTVPGDVVAGRPTLPVRGFRIFLIDLQSRRIRRVYWEHNSGAWQYALDQIDFKEPFNASIADDGVKYEEYSCGKSGW